VRTPGTLVPRDPLLEFGSPSEFVRLPAARSPSPPRPVVLVRRRRPERFASAGSASPGFLTPTNTTTPGAPFAALRRSDSRWAKGCRPSAGAVLRVLAPLDGSGCTSRRSVPLARHAVGRDAPTLGGLVSCRSRSWSRPSELFTSRGAVPAFAGLCFLAGSRSTAARRDVLEGFTTAFRAAPTSLPQLALSGSPDAEAVTTFPRDR